MDCYDYEDGWWDVPEDGPWVLPEDGSWASSEEGPGYKRFRCGGVLPSPLCRLPSDARQARTVSNVRRAGGWRVGDHTVRRRATVSRPRDTRSHWEPQCEPSRSLVDVLPHMRKTELSEIARLMGLERVGTIRKADLLKMVDSRLREDATLSVGGLLDLDPWRFGEFMAIYRAGGMLEATSLGLRIDSGLFPYALAFRSKAGQRTAVIPDEVMSLLDESLLLAREQEIREDEIRVSFIEAACELFGSLRVDEVVSLWNRFVEAGHAQEAFPDGFGGMEKDDVRRLLQAGMSSTVRLGDRWTGEGGFVWHVDQPNHTSAPLPSPSRDILPEMLGADGVTGWKAALPEVVALRDYLDHRVPTGADPELFADRWVAMILDLGERGACSAEARQLFDQQEIPTGCPAYKGLDDVLSSALAAVPSWSRSEGDPRPCGVGAIPPKASRELW